MRVMLIDTENLGLDFALRCVADGHQVRWFRPSTTPIRDGEGFPGITVVTDWRKTMSWVSKDGLVFLTGNAKYLRELDRYREFGWHIFGPTEASADLEIIRSKGMEAMKAAGINVPPYETFDSLEAAEQFARKSDRAWVFKPLGDTEDKALTYVSHDPADLCGWLQRRIKAGQKVKSCMLQEKIDMLCELGVSGWFGPEGFLPDRWQIAFEYKKLMPGDIGPNTGEQGTVTQYVTSDKLASECLLPMAGVLGAMGHRGDFAVGVGIDKSGREWPFEFTARAGWPAFMNQIASHKGDVAQWMMDLLNGKDSLKVSQDVCLSVVCGQPPYPANNGPAALCEGNPIVIPEDAWDDTHPCSVMLQRGPVMAGDKVVMGPSYQTTGPYVLVATGTGKTVKAAQKSVYDTVKEIRFPNMMYRNDIGSSLEKKLPALHKFGYAKDMEFE